MAIEQDDIPKVKIAVALTHEAIVAAGVQQRTASVELST